MNLGKLHNILFPQDKSRNYKFPNEDGVLATKEYVGDTLQDFVPDKRKIEEGLGFSTTYIKLSSTFASIDNTFKDLTEFQFDVFAGKTYDIELIGFYRSNLTSMGCKLGVRLSSGTGLIIGYIAGGVSGSVVATELKAPIRFISSDANQVGASLALTGVSSTSIDHVIESRLVFTCATDGRFTFTFGNETTGTATVNLMKDSQLKVIEY